MALDPAAAAVIGASIGATAALLGGVLNTWLQLRLEQIRWPKLREDAIAVQYREAVRVTATAIASVLHSMCWLTWAARERASAITQTKIDAYDAEVHQLFPQITGSLAAIAALDFPTYQHFRSFAEELYKLDYRIGKACLSFDDKPEKCIQLLREYWNEAQTLDQRFPQDIADVVENRVRARADRVLRRDKDAPTYAPNAALERASRTAATSDRGAA